MAIIYDCPECGRKVTAPDELAGKKARCPFCQSVVSVPGSQPYEAEAVPPPREPEAAPPRWQEEAPFRPQLPPRLEQAARFREPEERPREREGGDERRPCPMCGEMILRSAMKCRYCGEIFDTVIRPRAGNRHLQDSYNVAICIAGGIWCFFGGLMLLGTLALAGVAPGGLLPGFVGAILFLLAVLGGLWLLFGICACCKQIWAAWAGLIFSYLWVLMNLVSLLGSGGRAGGGRDPGAYICVLVFFIGLVILAIVQAHRAIAMYGQVSRRRRYD